MHGKFKGVERPALAGVVVPLTICITFVVLKIMGQSFNMMTLGGLAAAGGLDGASQ